jgi:hypothetical protein
VSVFTDSSGCTVWEIAGRRGGNLIQVEGGTRADAWHRAAVAAATGGIPAE